MEFVIKIKNGKPFGHPIDIKNFIQAYPDIDINNLPDSFCWFVRVPRPNLPPYCTFDPPTPIYQCDGNVVKDLWVVRAMTKDEIEQNYNFFNIGVSRV